MLAGKSLHPVDKKGRIAISARLRSNIAPAAGNKVYFTRSLDGNQCIDLHPADVWSKHEEKLSRLNKYDDTNGLFLRLLLEDSGDVIMDDQGRILIPQSLLKFAGIENEVLLLGVLDKIEVWNPKIYEEYIKRDTRNFAEMAKQIMKNAGE